MVLLVIPSRNSFVIPVVSVVVMVAAHQLNRKCYGIEFDPKYCEVIIDRMRKLDESMVIKKNGVVI